MEAKQPKISKIYSKTVNKIAKFHNIWSVGEEVDVSEVKTG